MADANWVREYQDGETVSGTPYQVIRLLGAGGMGSVYEVEHIELGRRYVLKSLLRTLTARQDLIQRMRNEWRALGRLHHVNIVDVTNAGTTADGVPYYVMELLTGETVRDRIERLGRLPVADAARIAQGTLLGLAAAHAIGVIHRDIKPANVFLTREGAVKVLDFGIAQTRAAGMPKITAQGLAIGTPRYMSPEQASGEKADERSDIYAVGLLLFEMLAGCGPFDDLGDTTQQMLAHLHRPARPLSDLVDVPYGISGLVRRALAKDPHDRPRSAQYMAAELEPFVPAHEPPSGPRVGTPTPPITAPTAAGGMALQAEWEARAPAVSSSRGLSFPPPIPDPPARLITRGTALGAALIAAAIVGIVLFILSPRESATSPAGALPGASADTPTPIPVTVAATSTTAGPTASAGAGASTTMAGAKVMPASSATLTDAGEIKSLRPAATAHKVDDLDDPPPPTRLPPSGL